MRNAKEDTFDAMIFLYDILSQVLSSKHLIDEMSLKLKMRSVKEFTDLIQTDILSPIKLNQLVDNTLKLNTKGINELRGLLNFTWFPDKDKTMKDVVKNTRIRGGFNPNRINMFCSSEAFMNMRRLLEKAGDHLLGCSSTQQPGGSSIDPRQFMRLYLTSVYEYLDPINAFDANGVCKYSIRIAAANDGSRFASCPFNIFGWKMFPLYLADGTNAPLHHYVFCHVLSIFIGKDSVENVSKFHGPLYEFFERGLEPGDYMSILVDDDRVVKFKIDYVWSGDMKSLLQLTGMPGLCAMSKADFMFCCRECIKETGMLPNVQKCGPICLMARELGVEDIDKHPCRHYEFCRKIFELPETCARWGKPIMDTIASAFFGAVIETVAKECKANQTTSDDEVSGCKNKKGINNKKRKIDAVASTSNESTDVGNEENLSDGIVGKEAPLDDIDMEIAYDDELQLEFDDALPTEEQMDTRITIHDLNNEFEKRHGDMRIHFIEMKNTGKRNNSALIYKSKAYRESGFTYWPSSKEEALKYLVNFEATIRRVILLDLRSNNDQVTYNKQYVSINDATSIELMHFLKIRVCHSKEQYDSFNINNKSNFSKELNDRVLSVLSSTYGFEADDSLSNMNGFDLTQHLVHIIATIEQYTIYFIREYNGRTIKEGIVGDKMKMIFCTLHMNLRISGTLLQDMLNNLIMNKFNVTFAQQFLIAVEKYVSFRILQQPGSENTASICKFRLIDNVVQPLSFDDKKLTKIVNKIDGLIDFINSYRSIDQTKHIKGFLTLKSNPETYRKLFKNFNDILSELKSFTESNTTKDFVTWQIKKVDPWVTTHLTTFGYTHQGYYIHLLGRGHVCEQLIEYKNIHQYSQQSWEGEIGHTKRQFAGHSQMGGHCGGSTKTNNDETNGEDGTNTTEKSNKKPKTSSNGTMSAKTQENICLSSLRVNIRRSMYFLYPDTNKLLQKLEEVKPFLQNGNFGLVSQRLSSTITPSIQPNNALNNIHHEVIDPIDFEALSIFAEETSSASNFTFVEAANE